MQSEKLMEMLQKFYRAFLIPVSLYSHDQLVISYVAIAFEPNLASLYLKNALCRKNRDINDILYVDHHSICCGMVLVSNSELRILVGPVSTLPPTLQQCSDALKDLDLPFSRKREFFYWLKKIPAFDRGRFISLLRYLDFTINGTVWNVADADAVAINAEPGIQSDEFYEVYHNSQKLENAILNLVEAGKINDLTDLLTQIRSSETNTGVTADSSIRIMKNAFVTSTALISRAAVRGGMSYDHALTLSDTYIRNMEKLENENEIAPFLGLMMVDYCNQVAKINKPENCSPLTVAVLDDVNRHLRGSVTVADISERLHKSISYISHTFEQEMHIPLKQYILQEKIKEAQHLLSSEHFSISEIAIMLGFSSQAHFQTVFKRITGVTPSAYRKQYL